MNIEESARKNIAQELKINQSSQCPYVVVCYQSFYDNGAVSIILEYMDGGSLADFLKKVHRIPEPCLAAICKQVGKCSSFFSQKNLLKLLNNALLSTRYSRACGIFTMKNILSTGI